jgi:cytoskeletal protein RodZ
MTHDHAGENMDQTDTAEGNVIDSNPVASEAGEHGPHSGHDHAGHDDHLAHDTHGGHGEDDSEKSTLVPVTWRQLIFPAIILLIVLILLIGPVSAAFAPRPAVSPATTEQQTTNPAPTVAPTSAPSGAKTQVTSSQKPPTATAPVVAAVRPTTPPPPPQPTATSVDAISPAALATRTAVAVLGEQGQVSRAPVQLQFAGAQFTIDQGSGVLPDWKPSGDATHATWIQGTYANHLIYLQYSDANLALFNSVKPGDTVKLTMDTGQVFEFQVSLAQRASNGPPTSSDQFTVTTAMNQDHAGVTLFLVGDPAPDRAVVQADFTGNIQ